MTKELPAGTDSSNERINLSKPKKILRNAMATQRKIRTSFDRKHYLPQLAERLAKKYNSAQKILDIGSGPGYFGESLQEALQNAQIVSIDMGTDHVGETVFVRSSAYALPFAEDTFDVVTLFYVLHHLYTPKEALEEAKRVSKNNRIVVQEDTYKNRLQKLLFETHVRGYQEDASYQGSSIKTDKEWQELFEEAGLEVEEKRRIRKLGYPVPRYEYHLRPKQSPAESTHKT